MEVRRLNPETGLKDILSSLESRIKDNSTGPSGNIVVRDTLTTTDPDTGVTTIFGKLPDGSVGFQPFVNDTTPPPVPSTLSATSSAGTVIVTWDGTFVGGELAPTDFQYCNVYGTRSGDPTPTLFGSVKNANDSVIAGADTVTPGDSWTFWATSLDYNKNESAAGSSTGPVTINSVLDTTDITNQINANSAAITAAQAAVASKSTIWRQDTTPVPASGQSNKAGDLWFKTNEANKPYAWDTTTSTWVEEKFDAGSLLVPGTITAASGVIGDLSANDITSGILSATLLNASDVRAAILNAGKITANDMVAGTITAASGIIADINADKISSGTINATHVAVGSGTNALSDPAFNSVDITNARTAQSTGGTAGWVVANGTSTTLRKVTRTTTTTSGTFAYLTAPHTFANAGQLIPCVAGQLWNLKVDTTTSIAANISFQVYTAKADGTVAVSTLTTTSPSTTGQRTISATYTIPAGVTGFMVGLICDTSGVTWTIHGNAFVGQQVTGDLLVNGAIDGKTVTGATIQTAVSGARIVLDSTGLNGWDASGNNYLNASSTGIGITGTITTHGVVTDVYGVHPMAAVLGQVPVQDQTYGHTTFVPGLGFGPYVAGQPVFNGSTAVCGIWSADGNTISIAQGGGVDGGMGGSGAQLDLGVNNIDASAQNQINISARSSVNITGSIGITTVKGGGGVEIYGQLRGTYYTNTVAKPIPMGVLSNTRNTGTATFSTSIATIMNPTLTLQGGSTIRVTFHFHAVASVADAYVGYSLLANGVEFRNMTAAYHIPNFGQTVEVIGFYKVPTFGNYTISATGQVVVTSATISAGANTVNSPGINLIIEDIGGQV